MYIALIADDNKKELMAQFCIAYSAILSRHRLLATHVTGNYLTEAAGLEIETFLAGSAGGIEQIASHISFNEIDVLFYFRSTNAENEVRDAQLDLLRLCDTYNVPVATNIATAEVLVNALDNGALDYRVYINPRSEYNQIKRKH